VERFASNLEAYKRAEYKEERVRVEFINPFFEALGRDVRKKLAAATIPTDKETDAVLYDLVWADTRGDGRGGGVAAIPLPKDTKCLLAPGAILWTSDLRQSFDCEPTKPLAGGVCHAPLAQEAAARSSRALTRPRAIVSTAMALFVSVVLMQDTRHLLGAGS
jgi:hypothetical protein